MFPESFLESLLQQIISNLNGKDTEADLLDYFVGDTDIDYDKSESDTSCVEHAITNNKIKNKVNYNPYNYVYTDKDLLSYVENFVATDPEVVAMLESVLGIEVN